MATSTAYRFTFFATRGAGGNGEHEKSELQLAELNLYGEPCGEGQEPRSLPWPAARPEAQ